MKGTVKFFNSSKGFGFIEPAEGGKDIFVHANNLNGIELNEGDKVTFETQDTDRGKTAVKVSRDKGEKSKE